MVDIGLLHPWHFDHIGDAVEIARNTSPPWLRFPNLPTGGEEGRAAGLEHEQRRHATVANIQGHYGAPDHSAASRTATRSSTAAKPAATC